MYLIDLSPGFKTYCIGNIKSDKKNFVKNLTFFCRLCNFVFFLDLALKTKLLRQVENFSFGRLIGCVKLFLKNLE